MKAIILERRGDYAAVLCEDGVIVKTRQSGEVGETIELKAETVTFPAKKKSRRLRSAVAAALVLAVTGSALGYMGGTASAYVSLDVEDSSIELAVNHFGRVIAVSAVSEDAEELAASLSGEVKHQRVEDALDHTMERLRDRGYLDDESDAVIAGVASDNGKRASELTQSVESAVGGGHTVYVSESSRAEREQAIEQKISVGRFGFERDHGALPGKVKGASEKENDVEVRAEPAVPASGTENKAANAPQARDTEQPPQDAPPQQEANAGRPEPPQSSERPNEPKDEPPQNGGQPEQPQGQPPQGGEHSEPQQGQPPQGGEQMPPAHAEPYNPAERENGAPQNAQGRHPEQRGTAEAVPAPRYEIRADEPEPADGLEPPTC